MTDLRELNCDRPAPTRPVVSATTRSALVRQERFEPGVRQTVRESMIGPQLTAIAALAVFAERTQAPAVERFLELVQHESARPRHLKNGLRPRRSILSRPRLGQSRTQC